MSRSTLASFGSARFILGALMTGLLVAVFGGAAHAALLPALPTLTGGGTLALRLDANAINGDGNPNPSDGASVSTWTDLAGANNAVAGSSPTYSAAGLGGQPTVQFDGSNNYLKEPLALSGPVTIFVVYQQNAALGSGSFQSLLTLANTGAGTDDEILLMNLGGGYTNISTDMDYSTNTAVGFNPTLNTLPHLLAIDYSGSGLNTPGSTPANYQISYDQTVETVTNSSIFNQTPNTGRIADRADGPTTDYGTLFNGDISEILIYTGNLNTTDFNAVQSYLGNEFFPTPEPTSLALFLVGGVMTLRRRRA